MRRLLWPLGVVVAFGAGVAAGHVPWQQSAVAEIDRLKAQISMLEARVKSREARPASQTTATIGTSGMDASLAPPSPGRVAARSEAPAWDRGSRRSRGQDGPAASSARPNSSGPAPAGSVDAALQRFYSFFDDKGGPGRWQRWQQLAEDFRNMGPAGTEALKRVLAAGTSSDERRTAAQLLGEMRDPSALPALQQVLESDSDLLTRRAAAAGLRRLEAPESAPYLTNLIANGNEDRFVRLSAASGLAQMGQPQGVTALTQIFDEANADGRGRDMAFRAIRSLDDDRAVPFMRGLVNSTAEPNYRLQAIRFLGAQGDQAALPSLQQVMQSPVEQPSIKEAASQAHAAILSHK